MRQKKFVGSVERNEAESFNGSDGTLVEIQKLEINLTEDTGQAFSISKQHPQYEKIKAIPLGTRIMVITHAELRANGTYKWKLDDVEPSS